MLQLPKQETIKLESIESWLNTIRDDNMKNLRALYNYDLLLG